MNDASSRSLSGQVALVTGAGRGIGAAIATTLSRMGAHAILCGRTLSALQSTEAAIHAEGGGSSQKRLRPCSPPLMSPSPPPFPGPSVGMKCPTVRLCSVKYCCATR